MSGAAARTSELRVKTKKKHWKRTVGQGSKEIPQIEGNAGNKRYYINDHPTKKGGESCLIMYDKMEY